jgi:hypothetical protein
VGQNLQAQIAALTPVAEPANVGSLPAFDHRDDGFDLGALRISVAVEASFHETTVPATGRFV